MCYLYFSIIILALFSQSSIQIESEVSGSSIFYEETDSSIYDDNFYYMKPTTSQLYVNTLEYEDTPYYQRTGPTTKQFETLEYTYPDDQFTSITSQMSHEDDYDFQPTIQKRSLKDHKIQKPISIHSEFLESKKPFEVCPKGFSLEGEKCVYYEIVPTEYKCPPGSTYDTQQGKCHSYCKGDVECPKDCEISGDKCVCVKVKSVSYMCPKGKLSPSGKDCFIKGDITESCPTGYIMDEEKGYCIQKIAPSFVCKKGTVQKGHVCMDVVSFSPDKVCPVGTRIDDKNEYCYKFKKAPAKCPKGFMLNKKTGKCYKKFEKELGPCPKDFEPLMGVDIMCIKKVKTFPDITCFPGSEYDASTHQCVSHRDSSYECPEDYVPTPGEPHKCQKIVDEIGICPASTIPVGSGEDLKCEYVVEHDLVECCPPDFELKGKKCVKIEFLGPPKKKCETCKTVKFIHPTYKCPDDYTLFGQYCIKTIVEPCSTKHKESDDPFGEDDEKTYLITGEETEINDTQQCDMYKQILQSVSLRSMAEIEGADLIPKECLKPKPTHSPKKECKKEIKAPATPICPAGSHFIGKECQYDQVFEPEGHKCEIGKYDEATGKCIKVITIPAKTECKSGSKRVGHQCLQYKYKTPVFKCPPEASQNKKTKQCLVYTHAHKIKGEADIMMPMVSCPSGNLENGVCWTTEHVRRQYMCPKNSVPLIDEWESMDNKKDHDCAEFTDIIVPPPITIKTKPLYFCSDGGKAVARKCFTEKYFPTTYECPPGTKLESHHCIRAIKPSKSHKNMSSIMAVPYCHSGNTPHGTKCIEAKEYMAMVKCPPHYHPSGLYDELKACYKEVKHIEVCPVGTKHTSTGCLQARYKHPIAIHLPHRKNCIKDECDD